MKLLLTFGALGAALMFTLLVVPAAAHPGNTAADGCHYCRTNCDQWGVGWNVRHCHGGRQSKDDVYKLIFESTEAYKIKHAADHRAYLLEVSTEAKSGISSGAR